MYRRRQYPVVRGTPASGSLCSHFLNGKAGWALPKRYRGPYALVSPLARPQNWHYWETALIGAVVTYIFMHVEINVCLLRFGYLSCFAMRDGRFAVIEKFEQPDYGLTGLYLQ